MEAEQVERGRRPIRRVLGAAAVALLALSTIQPSAEVDAQTNAQQETLTGVENSVPSRTETTESLGCSPGSLVKHGVTDKPWVSLTIDDGPDPKTSAFMDTFDANGEHGDGTFFATGQQVLNRPAMAKEVADRGFDIGNHTVTHQYVPSIIASEIARDQQIIKDTTGITPVYFRSPGLTEGAIIQDTLASLGMCNISISVDSLDSKLPIASYSQICANIRREAKPGSIILFHDGGGNHIQTLLAFQNCLFQTLRDMNLEVVPLRQILTGVEDIGTRVPAGGHVEIQAGAPGQTVVGQLTVDGALGDGYLTAYPCSEGQPPTSDINYVRNEANANLIFVKLDEQGKFCVSVNGSATHIIFDETAEVFSSKLPVHNAVRKYDSRLGVGKLAAGQVLRLMLAGPNQIVIGQITNDQAKQAGFITAFTCDAVQPTISNLNYVPGRPSSNRYVAQANANGEVCFFSSSETDLVIDQLGELDQPDMIIDTGRKLDTRLTGSALPDGGTLSIATGQSNQTIIGQLTVDRERGAGYAVMYPCDQNLPTASNVNFASDRPRSSSVVVMADANGTDCVYTSKGTDVVFDKIATAPWQSHGPIRLLDTRTTPQ